jgi:mycofactocin system glycosyltransferase
VTVPDLSLPDGFGLRLGRRVRVTDGGRALIGGSPTRVLYLSAEASRLVVDRQIRVTNAASRTVADRLLEAGMADPVLASLPPVDQSEVTFVVPVYGRPAALDRLLTSIGEGRSVIVVDDVSPDRPAIEAIVRAHTGVRYLALSVNGGPAAARNEGLRHVTTPYVAFVDSDIVLDADATSILLRHFADPRVALAAPRVLGLRDDRGLNWIGRYEESRSSLDLGIHPATVRPRSPVSWVPGAFLIARVDAIGSGFSAEMREGEDVDFVWRLAENGWRIRFEPAARVWHEHRQGVGDWLGRKAFYGSSAHPLSVRHPHDIAPAVLPPWSVGVLAALLAQRRWSVPVAVAISVCTAVRVAAKLGRSERPYRVAATLTATGVTAALVQAMALLVRHWWPLAVVVSIFSTRIRRALVLSSVVDAALEYRRTRPDLDPARFALARRLDDLAYGSGVWFSAIRGRSIRALLPDFRRR